ncbi:hypothetical protein CTEN210_08556 [Chaetoceros tenuissimus]|uniref:Uncharacterized protein n=1 Tax=Chaetoceros tenuissimus TaxID=426638 RepID=A0AAD3CW76_9STRA|nr:hypothetical protein CTEN210_08556 [Chaetoceros tenuissimus]
MRSCEYSKTSYKEESKQTKILEINNFCFFKRNRQLDILKDTADLKNADYVDINFILQKNNEVDDSVGLYDSEDDWRSPTFIWGTIIETILGYPGTDSNSPVNTWFDPKKKKLVYINSKQICTQLSVSAHAIGSDKLGFSPDEIGCHSICSGGAMALYLSNPNELIIMLIG